MVCARGIARASVITDEAHDTLAARPGIERGLPGPEIRILRRLLVFQRATGPAERFARQGRVGQAHFEDAVIDPMGAGWRWLRQTNLPALS